MSEHDRERDRPKDVRVRVADRRRVRQETGETREPPAEAEPPGAAEAEPPGAAEAGAAGEPSDVTASELDEARAQAAAYLDDLQRLKAEFENYRKRMVKEQTRMVERASGAVVERMLPILDNFELALLAADRTKDYQALVRGIEIVYGELLELLHREGLERIASLNQPFDPELHEAVLRIEGESEELVVIDEMRPGYTLGGRVVRPAMVKVGPRRAPTSPQTAPPE